MQGQQLWHWTTSPSLKTYFKFFLSFLGGGTGVWTQDFTLQSRHSTAWAILSVHFAVVILEMESCELFARAGLQPRSSWSQPPKYLGWQVWTTGTQIFWVFKRTCRLFMLISTEQWKLNSDYSGRGGFLRQHFMVPLYVIMSPTSSIFSFTYYY
jgi:hypothetical protein